MTKEDLRKELIEELVDKYGEDEKEYLESIFDEIYETAEVNCGSEDEEGEGEDDYFDLPEEGEESELNSDDEFNEDDENDEFSEKMDLEEENS